MIYTVTLNPSIDYIVEVENLELGSLNRMKRDLKLPGGKGINVSRVLNQLAVGNTAVGFLGGFTGRYIDDKLREEGIGCDFVFVQDDTRINVKLKSAEETEINGLGPDISAAEAEALLGKLSGLQPGDIMVLSGSAPPALGGEFYGKLIQAAKQAGAEFVIDTTGQALLDALPQGPLVVKPNHHELAELFGVELETREELIVYGRKLLELGAKHVLISMAGEGALLITPEAAYHASAPSGTVRNSVGAGDSMIAGFVGTLHQGGNEMEAFRSGVACGSATAFADDLASREEIMRLLPDIQIKAVQ
ncbi:1-phosphofructokinase [Paenibacillus sp. NFR01]|uniref:1-phosphofructokinase n=1 Tax=Paenibacillus sp. NFR01 TaxID=1566279 RepID=UPI0008C86BEA|nr:1-phosphofructokinase [Paenibacillus sp. NFR01]SET96223.1 1-phosphofructokinase [Paenibacillus sp. NFR01]